MQLGIRREVPLTQACPWLGIKEHVLFSSSSVGFIVCLGPPPADVHGVRQQLRHRRHGHVHGQLAVHDEDDFGHV